MDPINIPPWWDRIYTSTMDPSWGLETHGFCGAPMVTNGISLNFLDGRRSRPLRANCPPPDLDQQPGYDIWDLPSNTYTLWLCQNSFWKWWFLVVLPIEHGDFNHSYVNVYQRVLKKLELFQNWDILWVMFFLGGNDDKQWGLFSRVAYSDAPKWLTVAGYQRLAMIWNLQSPSQFHMFIIIFPSWMFGCCLNLSMSHGFLLKVA